ncbi:MAG TPA: hypothetical protein DEA63_01045 [Firmicutes bacterium]|nr:hypothetical protein [Bacillota bacterium]
MNGIRLGKISKRVEKALSLSLTSEVGVYASGDFLDSLAKTYPDHYLKIVDAIGKEILKSPDFVSFEQKKEEFRFLKIYCKNGIFSFWEIRLKHLGKPKKWMLVSFGRYQGKGIDFERV